MKNNTSQYPLWLVAFVCVACAFFVAWKCAHVPSPHLCIARIDSLKIKNTAEPFVKVRGWFEKQCQNTQSELTEKIHGLQKTYEWLKVIKKDEKSRARHEEFRQEVAGLERTVQERKDQLTQQFGVTSAFLEEKLKQVIAQLARAKGVSLVLNQHINEIQALLFADEAVLDITEDVIRLLNQETQNLHLPELGESLEKKAPPEGNALS